MNPERLTAERALFKRIIISFHDLHEARRFLHELLALGEIEPFVHRRTVVQQALMTAFVVAYGRPFSGNESEARVRPKLPPSFLKGLSPAQKEMHNRLLELRNEEFAHSDPHRSNVQVGIGTGPGGIQIASPISQEVRQGLTTAHLHTARSVLTVIIAKVHDELFRLQNVVVDGTPF
jgi:hypothetical protein